MHVLSDILVCLKQGWRCKDPYLLPCSVTADLSTCELCTNLQFLKE